VGVVSTGTQLYLGFAADYSINDRGFNASWTEVLVPNVIETSEIKYPRHFYSF
jgi:hypothetical protein